jgi:hypothetical protein
MSIDCLPLFLTKVFRHYILSRGSPCETTLPGLPGLPE